MRHYNYILIFCIRYQQLESYLTLLKKVSHQNKEIEFSLNSEPKFFIQKALLRTHYSHNIWNYICPLAS